MTIVREVLNKLNGIYEPGTEHVLLMIKLHPLFRKRKIDCLSDLNNCGLKAKNNS